MKKILPFILCLVFHNYSFGQILKVTEDYLYKDTNNNFSIHIDNWLKFRDDPTTENQVILFFQENDTIIGEVLIVSYPKTTFDNLKSFKCRITSEINSDSNSFSYIMIKTKDTKWVIDEFGIEKLSCNYIDFRDKEMTSNIFFYESRNRFIAIKLYALKTDCDLLTKKFNRIIENFKVID